MKKFIGFILIIITFCFASWTSFHYDAQNTGRTPYSPPPCDSTYIDILWSVYLGGVIQSSPSQSLSGDTIYIASNDDTLYAVYRDGTVLWKFALTGDAYYSSPAIDSAGNIYIGCNSDDWGYIYSIAPDGSYRWSEYCSPEIPSFTYHSPKINYVNGRVYITGNDTVSPPEMGWLTWIYLDSSDRRSNGLILENAWLYTAPAIDENNYIFALHSTPGGLTCYDSSYLINEVWTHTVPISGEIDFQSSPAIDTARNRIYYGGQNYGSNPNCQRLFAVDYTYSSHTDAWNFHMGAPVQWCTPAIRNDGSIILGANNGIIRAFSPDGTELWNYTCGGAIVSSPAVDNAGNVYVGCNDGYLYGFWVDGSLRFKIMLDGASIRSSPAISEDNRIYVGTNGGYLHCIQIGPCDFCYVYAMADTTVCDNDTFDFFASVDPGTSGPPIYWTVDFDDGTPIIEDSLLGSPWEINVEHYYSTPGTFYVTVNIEHPASLGSTLVIDSSFPSPTSDPGDLAFDGEHLWLSAHTSSYDTIYELTTTGAVIKTIPPPATLPYGLTFDGHDLWVSTTSLGYNIYLIDTISGAIVYGPLSSHGSDASFGLGWEGVDRLWEITSGSAGHDSAYVTNITDWANPLGGFLLPRAFQEGCAYDSVHNVLWVCSWDASTPYIYGLDPISGAVEYTFPTPSTLPQGLAFDGTCLWHSDKETDMIYRLCFESSIEGCSSADTTMIIVEDCVDEGLIVYPRWVEPCSWFSFWVRNDHPTEIAESTWVAISPIGGERCLLYIECDTLSYDCLADTAAFVYGTDIASGDSSYVTFFFCPNPDSCAEGDSICFRAEAFTSNPSVPTDVDTLCFQLDDCDSCWQIDDYCMIFHDPDDWVVVPCDSPVCFLWSECCWQQHCWGDTIFRFFDLYVDDSIIAESLYCCPEWICDSFINIPFDEPPLCPYYPEPGDTHTFYLIGYSDCDSNYSDTLHIIAEPCCAPAITWLECPFPCWKYSSCSQQAILFGIMDTAGLRIDTMRTYFTEIVFHSDGEVDTYYIHEPNPELLFTGNIVTLDSLIAQITGNWEDGDSVVFQLDSIFSVDSCLIYPP
ncbi:hypothetical protein DRQ33_03600 [bacterium]|nr:MAG: hypothetical protein DRQ33_03600 [bacterium]